MVGPTPPGEDEFARRDGGGASRPDAGGPSRRGAGSGTDAADDARGEGFLARGLAPFVPAAVARRAVAVAVDTDRRVYDAGDPVTVTVEFHNRLPVGIEVPLPGRRRWGWTVDGELEASDAPRYAPAAPSTFAFGPRERKRATVEWHGLFERTRGTREWVRPDPGEYEVAAFVATDGYRPRDATTIEIR